MVDLGKLIEDLVRFGKSEEWIAEQIGTTQATINRIKNGMHRSTSFDKGVRIAELHKREQRNFNRRTA